jgi:hypothetical protein
MILVQSDRERRVGGKNELRVALPPVPVMIGSPKKTKAASKEGYLMQAMFTGAETVAWWTMVGNKRANCVPQRVPSGSICLSYIFITIVLQNKSDNKSRLTLVICS